MEEQKETSMLPFASLSEEQLDTLRQAERKLEQAGTPVYLIAFARDENSSKHGK